jgi:hypothetical protein
LWPDDNALGHAAESDYPEADLDAAVKAYAHYTPDGGTTYTQDSFSTGVMINSGWHTYVQEWTPGSRKYYIDGTFIGESTNYIYSQQERWQLQIEPKGSAGDNGHVLIDWATVYSYTP